MKINKNTNKINININKERTKMQINENKQTNKERKYFFSFLGLTRIDLGLTYFYLG